ncbi:unnamed protein product [Linum tenue]|uniref:Uncharacterized protein n=1 Tax=Linum tenue TaxID=586396 RepID=A0AAV0MTB3_9ROSI|nr:unnamed protein product [Linum tenue]
MVWSHLMPHLQPSSHLLWNCNLDPLPCCQTKTPGFRCS